MTKASTKGSLEIDVTDFGAIVKARVDLRPATVFVGPDDTGLPGQARLEQGRVQGPADLRA